MKLVAEHSNVTFQFEVATRVFAGLYPGVTSTELDDFIAETAATMTTRHPDYAVLAARVAIFKLHKETKETFTGWLLI